MRTHFLILMLTSTLATASLAETTITYQGKLESSGEPFNDTVEMIFELHETDSGDTEIATHGPVSVEVSEGLFQEDLAFGAGVFDGDSRYLQIIIDGTPLTERHLIRPSPMALFAFDAEEGSGGEFWRLNGNSGTEPGTHFIGTTDDVAFEIHVNADDLSSRAWRVEPTDDPDDAPNLIGGHHDNWVGEEVVGATIAGGGMDDDSGSGPNRIDDSFGTISGGRNNEVSGFGAMVGGGRDNSAGGNFSTIGGGSRNNGGSGATVSGGSNNEASGRRSTVGGGAFNVASGRNAIVSGGENNEAAGDYSFAAGRNAVAGEDGSFVWADSLDYQFDFVGENGFLARATGGVGFVTGVNSGTPNAGASLASGGSSWQTISDRNAKTTITRVDPSNVLERLAQMPISEYSYKSQDESIRHMGPMAQDFYPLFGLGEDKLRVSAMNLAGIALAAIQGLDSERQASAQRVAKVEAENAELRDKIAGLHDQVAANSRLADKNAELEDRLATLEALLLEDRQVAERQ